MNLNGYTVRILPLGDQRRYEIDIEQRIIAATVDVTIGEILDAIREHAPETLEVPISNGDAWRHVNRIAEFLDDDNEGEEWKDHRAEDPAPVALMIRDADGDPTRVQCPQCKRRYRFLRNLTQHLDRVHNVDDATIQAAVAQWARRTS